MVTCKKFGRTLCGKDITLYSLTNSKGMQADVMDFGAILVNLFVPNKAGEVKDVVLGYDRPKDYFENGSFFGATVGPVANRTANATYELDGITYNLAVNDGPNNLHSDFAKGFHKAMWDAKVLEDRNAVEFSYSSKDGYLGFPGNREFKVTYTLTEENAIEIHYDAVTDKNTIFNPTNHTYFNLKGHDSETTVEDVVLTLKASHYTKVIPGAIPTGEIAPVAGTPFDFTTAKVVGKEIDAEHAQLALVKGYDHNFVVDDYKEGQVQKIAVVEDAKAQRTMEVYSDLPGVQFYTGNNMVPELGKGDAYYPVRGGLCLETQFYPNSANQEGFIKPLLAAGKPFASTTIYKFV